MKSLHYISFSAIFFISLFCFPLKAQIMAGETLLDTSTIVTGLDTPWEILWGPDDHIWMTERYGRVSRIDPETGTLTELLIIDEVYENQESGLLGMAIHRDFTNKPLVYLVYTYQEGSITKERLVSYTYSDNTLNSEVILLDDIQGASFHIGSRIVTDLNNNIIMTTGDATQTSTAQNLNSMSGKVLRIDQDGNVPPDNPITDSYIYSLGHRNPQGLVITDEGIIYSSEHGPDSDDEVNIIYEGGNYGWPDVEGYCDREEEIDFCDANTVIQPIIAWTPTLAVAGIDYYSNDAIPAWNNALLVTSLKAGQLLSLKLDQEGNTVVEENVHIDNLFGRLRDICISPNGDVYISTSNNDGRGSPNTGDDRIIRLRNSESQNVTNFTGNTRLNVFPNPLNGDELFIKANGPEPVTISIFDQSGKEVFRKKYTVAKEIYNIGFPFEPGVYFISSFSKSEVSHAKLIKIE